MKKGHLVLSLLILGKRKVKDMSIYLAPLIDELCNLWNGVQVVDNSTKGRQKTFNVRAILMWKMHDYLGYGDVRKYSVQGYHACPLCGLIYRLVTVLISRRWCMRVIPSIFLWIIT